MNIILKKAEFLETAIPLDLAETITKLELLTKNYNNLAQSYNLLVMHFRGFTK